MHNAGATFKLGPVRILGPPPPHSDSPAGFPTTRSEMIENEHADCRREIVAIATVGNPLYQRRGLQIFAACNLLQSIPEFVFKGHTRLVSVEHNGTFDDERFHDVSPRRISQQPGC